jgi:hypothetical protein
VIPDKRLPGSEGKETPTVAADENGGMGPLNRKGIDRVAGHAIMPTSQGDVFSLPLSRPLTRVTASGQQLDPDASGVEVKTCLFVFGLHVPRA